MIKSIINEVKSLEKGILIYEDTHNIVYNAVSWINNTNFMYKYTCILKQQQIGCRLKSGSIFAEFLKPRKLVVVNWIWKLRCLSIFATNSSRETWIVLFNLEIHVKSMGTSLTKCSSKFDTMSTKRPTVDVANCVKDIDIVTMNINRISRMHSTKEARGYSTMGGIMFGIFGSVRMK